MKKVYTAKYACGLSLLIVALFTINSNAQIFYQSDDTTISTNDHYDICLDSQANHGAPYGSLGTLYIWNNLPEVDVNSFSSDCQVLFNGSNVAALNKGDTISSADKWITPSYSTLNNPYSGIGDWKGVTNNYLGVRLNMSGSYYYGWIRMDVNDSATSYTIHDYASNTQPGAPIAAGQTSATYVTSLNTLGDVKMITSGNDIAFMNLPSYRQAVVSIFDMNGKRLQQCNLSNNGATIHSLPKGIYIIKLQVDNAERSFKVSF